MKEIINEQTNDIKLKESAYEKANHKKRNIFIILSITLIYAALFTSKLWLFPPLEKATKVGEHTSYYLDREVSLVAATYDSDKEKMEVVLNLENNSLDNIDEYYYAYTVQGQKASKVKLKEVYNEKLFTVIEFDNLKNGYRELKLLIAPKIVKIDKVTDSMTATIVLNKNNVKQKSLKNKKTKKDFLKLKLESNITNQKVLVKKSEKDIAKIEEEIKAIDKTKSNYDKDKKYLSDDEKEKYEQTIIANDEKRITLSDTLSERKKEKEGLKKELEELKSRKNNL